MTDIKKHIQQIKKQYKGKYIDMEDYHKLLIKYLTTSDYTLSIEQNFLNIFYKPASIPDRNLKALLRDFLWEHETGQICITRHDEYVRLRFRLRVEKNNG